MKEIDPDVHEALLQFVESANHEFIRGLYNLNRHLRNKLQCDKIPIHTLYVLSLFKSMEEDHTIDVNQLATREGLNKRTAYNIQKKFYEHRRVKRRVN